MFNDQSIQSKVQISDADFKNCTDAFSLLIYLDKKYNPHLYLEGKLKEEIITQNNDRHSDTNSSKTLG
jgi:hypothetical protein